MQQRTQIILFVVLLGSLLESSNGKCNTCGTNGIACVNQTAFHICTNGVPDTTSTLNCPDSYVCTDRALRCMPSQPELIDCNLNVGCGICDGRNMFTCTSRTQFAQCNDEVMIDGKTGSCPSGYVCDATQNEICVKDCKKPSCERDPVEL